MKVVQLVMARQYRGAEIFAAQLSRQLIQQGVDVHYVSLYKNDSENVFIPEGIPSTALDEVKAGSFQVKVLRTLASALRELKPDLVQANAGDTLKYAVLVKIIYRMKYKIVFRNASMQSRYLRSSFQKFFNGFLVRNTNQIISVSQGSSEDMMKSFPFCQHKTVVIQNGITADPQGGNTVFQEDEINLIHVGGFTFEKNHVGLLRIFLRIREQFPKARLWLVGEGPLKASVEEEVSKLNMSDAVTFTGARQNVMEYIAAAKALLLPSSIEGMPAVILESFYSKTPVIAYNVGGISEVVKSGETGWLIKAGDEEGFVYAIHEVLQAPNHHTITENAYRLVTQEYDNRIIAQRFLNVYEALVGGE